MIFNLEMIGKVQEQVITGHGTTGKKVIGHPTLVEMIGVILMCENVDKQFAARFQESVHLFHQMVVVFHVFKHFDRHDSVIALDNVQSTLVIRHIAGNNGNISHIVSSFLGGIQNVFTLTVRVGDSGNLGIGVSFGQMQRQTTPSTTQIDNAHAILHARQLAVVFQHGHFRFFKGGILVGPQTRRVLFAGTQTQVIKLGRHFVVLFIGFVRGNGNGHGFQFVHNFRLVLQFRFDIVGGQNVEVVVQLDADSETNQKVWNQTHLDHGNERFGRVRQDVQKEFGSLLDNRRRRQEPVKGVSNRQVMRLDIFILGRNHQQGAAHLDKVHGHTSSIRQGKENGTGLWLLRFSPTPLRLNDGCDVVALRWF
mmetsp:Transcript_22765/g.47502  ORF Transcript_22765/g.47502 Transcript_22765/m.47502 type:complete len:366 (-) Transcript_22765:2-1099(-)